MKYQDLMEFGCHYDKQLFEQYNALYEGGKTFEKEKHHFLVKNEKEPENIYKFRKDHAEYQNFVGPIIDQLASQLFSSFLKITPKSEIENLELEFYSDFQNDVDGNRMDLKNFMQRAFINAVVKGCSWYIAELPNLTPEIQDKISAKSISQEQIDSLDARRVNLCAISNEQVLDYQVDSYGRFLGVKIYKCEYIRKNLLSPSVKRHTWRFYDLENVITFIKDEVDGKPVKLDEEILPQSTVKHGFGEVPVLKLEFPVGLWIMNRVASAQKGHFLTSANLDWALSRSAFPTPVFKSVDGTPPILGSGRWATIEKTESFEYVAPPADSFEPMVKRIESKRIEIYRVTQQMAAGISNSAVIGRSADSKSIDQSATEVCLQAYASFIKEAVERIFEMISNARGDVDLHFSIEGMNKFNSENLSTTITELKDALTVVTHSPSFIENVEKKIAALSFPDLDEDEKQEMFDEIELGLENAEIAANPLEKVEDTQEGEIKNSSETKATAMESKMS